MPRTITVALFLIFVGTSGLVEAQGTQEIRGKLFIIGGGSRPEAMVERMIEESGLNEPGSYGVILTMASSDPEESAYYGIKQFRDLGVDQLVSYDFGRRDSVTSSALDSLAHAQLIYLTGGVQSRFMDAVKSNPGVTEAIHKAYRAGSMIAGISAGAAVMSQIMITGDQKRYPEYTPTFYHIEKDNIVTAEGLGLVDNMIIDQHFVQRARNNRLLTAVLEFPDKWGIGIDESTAILIEAGNRVTVIGVSQVLVYRNRSEKTAVQNHKMGVAGIELGIYLPGDTFTLTPEQK